jgi:hypothetical protein
MNGAVELRLAAHQKVIAITDRPDYWKNTSRQAEGVDNS